MYKSFRFAIYLQFVLICLFPGLASGQQAISVSDHVLGDVPACEVIYIRQGYALCYDNDKRVPIWAAYRVELDFLNTPDRKKSPFGGYNQDPDNCFEPHEDEYIGLLRSKGYVRGHIAPYAVFGGDRDGDGQYAADGDDYDINTVLQGNYMSNIAPQIHTGFNGSGGAWFKLERYVQETLVRDLGHSVWVIAGTIFEDDQPIEQVGTKNNIWVPTHYFKIVVAKDSTPSKPLILAFLFKNQADKGDIFEHLVSIDQIENLTGIDLFRGVLDKKIEATNTIEYKKNLSR